MGRHGWAGLVHVPTGVCWRRHGRPTRPATSSGWAQTAGAPRSPLCCTWRRWPRAPSPSSPRGCPCEVGLAATMACPPPAPGSVCPAISITLTGPSYRPPPPPSLSSSLSSRILSLFFLGSQLLCAWVLGWEAFLATLIPVGLEATLRVLLSPVSDIHGCWGWWQVQEAHLSRLLLHPYILSSLLLPGTDEVRPLPHWERVLC